MYSSIDAGNISCSCQLHVSGLASEPPVASAARSEFHLLISLMFLLVHSICSLIFFCHMHMKTDSRIRHRYGKQTGIAGEPRSEWVI